MHQSSIDHCLWGCAIGDSVGLPFEGLTPKRIQALHSGKCRQRFFFGKGMVSDDTDHSVMVARSIIEADGDVKVFEASLRKQLKWWLVSIPAGVGKATLQSLIKMWLGVRSPGVFSAGNGPAMRSAIIGAMHSEDETLRREFVRCSSQLTHSDPKAYWGALAIAEIAARLTNGRWQTQPDTSELESVLLEVSDDEEWQELMQLTISTCRGDITLESLASRCGGKKGVTGYTYHTVPFAIAAWYLSDSFEDILQTIITAGGDTDSVAAIGCALAGISSPSEELDPWKPTVMFIPWSRKVFSSLAQGERTSTPWLPLLWLRNIVFVGAILVHVVRRMLPPY